MNMVKQLALRSVHKVSEIKVKLMFLPVVNSIPFVFAGCKIMALLSHQSDDFIYASLWFILNSVCIFIRCI